MLFLYPTYRYNETALIYNGIEIKIFEVEDETVSALGHIIFHKI